MQIVIDIHEKDYQSIKNGHIPFSILDVIMRGTPLPKGHGRLIDADELESRMKIGYCIVRNAKTIIDAESDSDDSEDIPMEYFESGGR